jgi:hypothetical protein
MRLFKVIQYGFMRLLGYKYVVNRRTKEIHRLDYRHANFDIYSIKNYSFVKNDADLDFYYPDYNGCRFCFPERDTDRYRDKDSWVEVEE